MESCHTHKGIFAISISPKHIKRSTRPAQKEYTMSKVLWHAIPEPTCPNLNHPFWVSCGSACFTPITVKAVIFFPLDGIGHHLFAALGRARGRRTKCAADDLGGQAVGGLAAQLDVVVGKLAWYPCVSPHSANQHTRGTRVSLPSCPSSRPSSSSSGLTRRLRPGTRFIKNRMMQVITKEYEKPATESANCLPSWT